MTQPRLDANEVAHGREIYLLSCSSCHGPKAEGALNWQRPDARGNLPPPPHDDSGLTWRHSDAQLAEVIQHGWRDPFNKTTELTMPPFKDQLSDDEVQTVIAYFKTLWSAEHRRYQEEQSQKPATPMSGSRPGGSHDEADDGDEAATGGVNPGVSYLIPRWR